MENQDSKLEDRVKIAFVQGYLDKCLFDHLKQKKDGYESDVIMMKEDEIKAILRILMK